MKLGMRIYILLALFALSLGVEAQNYSYTYGGYYSAQVYPDGDPMGYAILAVKSQEKLRFSFDVLDNSDNNLYYTIKHCDPFWNMDELETNEYIQGFASDRVPYGAKSSASFTPYTHYSFTIPNDMTRLSISGNYLLIVHEGRDMEQDNIRLVYQFVAYDNTAISYANVHPSSVVSRRMADQEIDFTIQLGSTPAYDMDKLIPVLIQNGNWNLVKNQLPPMYIKPNGIIEYDYNGEENSFPGGGEWSAFEIKSVKLAGYGVQHIEGSQFGYQATLQPENNEMNKAYSSKQDLNGKAYVTCSDFGDELSCDYVNVLFRMPTMYLGEEVYVECGTRPGNLTKCNYNEKEGTYETSILLKQGVYNYRFVAYTEDGPVYSHGNHSQTENDYLLFVYYFNRAKNAYLCASALGFNSKKN